MKKFVALALPLALLMGASPAFAGKGRNEHINFSIAELMGSAENQALLPTGVKYYFGTQKAPISKSIGPTGSSRKSSSFHKSDKVACERAALSVLIALGEDAKSRGGNAVVGIKSNYENNLTSSNETYVCGAGGIMAGVAFSGTVAVVR